MRKFDNETIKILEKKNVKKAKIKKDKARFLKILGECQEFKNIYKEYHCSEFVLDDKSIEGLAFNCHELFYDKLIKELYCKNFGNGFQYKERKIAIRKYTYRGFTLDSLFLGDDNIDRVDLLSALDLCCHFFKEEKDNNIKRFYDRYTMFMNKVNSGRICAWYSRSLEEVVELYCIYNHLTSKHYEYILEHCEIKRRTDIKGLLNYKKEREKEVCREDCVKELTATEKLRTNILEKGITETTVQGFVEYMEGQIEENPYNFSQLRYKTLISSALKELDKTIKIEDKRFNGKSYFTIDEWYDFIQETGIIKFEHKNDFYRYLFCLTEDIIQPATSKKEADKNLIERVTYNIAKKQNTLAGREKFSFETELIILRSLIIIKYYNEHDKAVFLEKTNEKLKELKLFQVYSIKNEMLKGFAIDYAVTNDL